MDRKKKYIIGLDIGTTSVGWAVVNPDNNKVLRIGKNKLWGVRLFEEGESAATRRGFRSTRRRYDRRRQRILYLQNIFYNEINKIDDSFFIRLKDSFLYKEDKKINCNQKNTLKMFKYNLFIDKNFNDSDYYKKYPTIYHLRYDLMKNPCNDIRLIYLALHHIIKYRGNFLYEGEKFDIGSVNISEKLSYILSEIKNNYDDIATYEYDIEIAKLKEILINKNINKREKQKLFADELNKFIIDKKVSNNIASLIIGIKANLLDIFSYEVQDSEQKKKCKISFEDTDYEDNLNDLEEIFGKNIELINDLKELYNEIYLNNMFKDIKAPTISYLMIKKYRKHKEDKCLLKEYLNEKDKKEFFSKNGIYQEYTKEPKKCSYDKLASELKKILSKYEISKTKEQILFDIENKNFLPKISDTANGIYPYQLNLNELNKIIEVQGNNFPFLKEKILEENGKESYKIAKLLTFRIPYYVGPLNRNINQKDSKAWIIKNNNDKITPFNFDKVVDKISCANEFIKRMTSNCTYLYDEKAMPANSLLFSKFKVLNELKQIKINGNKLDKETVRRALNELFLKYSKVSDKIFKRYLIEIKYPGANDIMDITGYSSDNGFANNLKPYIDFIKIFNFEYVFNSSEIIENLIEWITIFEDKKILKEKIKREYPVFSEDIINKICTLKYKGWSSLSKKLLTEVYYIDEINKDSFNIIELMEQTDDNFIQILFNKKYNFQEQVNELNFSTSINAITTEDIQKLATSPANKRAIWQTVKILNDLIKTIGYNPEHIYIEMAKGSEVKRRTNSREKQLLSLYENCKADINNYNALYKEIKNNKNLDIDKYYLYYLQQGKCLYTGKEISLLELNNCEIDHIIPRSLIKDDSLDNRALVFRKENQDKGANNILLERTRNSEVKSFWLQLKKNKFISDKKYNNLIRNEFRDKDIEGFINKQLVETRQITKHVADLLNTLYNPKCNVSSEGAVVQFINAKISYNYREKYELYKYRQINNLHHAHDAYLAAVLGNYKTLLFKNKHIKEFISDYKEMLKYKKKSNDYKCYGIIIDNIENDIYNNQNGEVIFDANLFKNIVCSNMYNQDILISKKPEIYTGEFYNQTIYKKGESKIPIKANLDPNKYGCYKSINPSYMMLIKYTLKNKKQCKLIGIPILYTVNKNNKNMIDSYIKKTINSNNYEIMKDKIPFKILIKFEDQFCYIVGPNEVINGVELKLPKNKQVKYKYLLNFICNNKYPNCNILPIEIQNSKHLEIKDNNINYWNKTFNIESNEFINDLIEIAKKEYPLFKNEIKKIEKTIMSGEFDSLPLYDENNISKKEVILQILRMLKANSENANLKKMNKTEKFSDRVGRKSSKNINNGIIYNKSITGLKEDKYGF